MKLRPIQATPQALFAVLLGVSTYFLSYNLLVLIGGPTFLIKKFTVLYTYMNGASIIRLVAH
jgi:hypothetical protein